MSDPLFTVVTGKMYFQIRFEDVPREYILGGRCMSCSHRGPVDRELIETRHGSVCDLQWIGHRYLRCLACGNRADNRFTVIGTYLLAPPLAEVASLASRKAA